MCLITEQKTALIAEEDITIYKIVTSNNGRMHTLYRNSLVKLGVEYKSKIDAVRDSPTRGRMSIYTVVNEALHAFTDKKKAMSLYKMYRGGLYAVSLLEGRIPKGSKYYTNSSEIAADTMIYDKILKKK